ncbi:MAG: M23 family metallopeptidase [Pseudomonadota bacterium]
MNIILVPGSKNGKGQIACLSHRHLILLLLVGLLALPIFVGVLTYRVERLIERSTGTSALALQERILAEQQVAIQDTRRHTDAHLNALTRRLGEMQAELLRLNALGARLTRMAKLDPREFNFSEPVGVGGPERPGVTGTAPDTRQALESLSRHLDRQREKLRALESVMLDRKLSAQITPSGWPVDGGWVSSGFGVRTDPFTGRQSAHEGADIAARLGSPVYAMGDGVISFAADKQGYGLTVEVTHQSGLVTRYAHLRALLAKVGDRVKKGQTVALVGTTGRSTGPHLHFEVVKQGVAVNPAGYLQNGRN